MTSAKKNKQTIPMKCPSKYAFTGLLYENSLSPKKVAISSDSYGGYMIKIINDIKLKLSRCFHNIQSLKIMHLTHRRLLFQRRRRCIYTRQYVYHVTPSGKTVKYFSTKEQAEVRFQQDIYTSFQIFYYFVSK